MNNLKEKMKTMDGKKAIIDELNRKGIFNSIKTQDGGPAGITPSNVFMPAGILTKISADLVKVVTRKRTADEIIGNRKKLGMWEQNDVLVRNLEQLGETKPYTDKDNAPVVSLNPQFIYAGHYRFSVKAQPGDLESAQMALANISNEAEQYAAALETLAIEFNNTAFFGSNKADGAYKVYGILNNPSLDAYKTASSTTANTTFETFFKDVRDLIQDVISKARGHASSDSNITIGIANSRALNFSLVNQYGQTVEEVLKKTFHNLKIVNSPELDKAYNEQDVMICRFENPDVANVAETAVLGFSEIALASPVVRYETYSSQKFSSGSFGCIVYKPYMIARSYFAS